MEIIIFFYLKIFIFTAVKNCCILPGAQFEGDLDEILALGAEILPYMVSGRSGKKALFFFHLVSTP